MANYQVLVKKSAIKELRVLPKTAANRVAEVLKGLADDPRPPGCIKLMGYSNY
jgi:mRNA interferase RelE/StbE